MTITCDTDWTENHHDVALVDEAGQLVAKRRIGDDAEGYQRLLELLVEAGETVEEPIPAAVEAARGLLIACLRTTGRMVYSINPMAAALGWAWLPGRIRICARRASRIAATTPLVFQRVKSACTVLHGGKSSGNTRHLMPLSVT